MHIHVIRPGCVYCTKCRNVKGIAIGDKVLCEVNEVDRYGNVHFDLILDNAPKGSLVSAYATKSHLQSVNGL